MALRNQSLFCIPFTCTGHSSFLTPKLCFIFGGIHKRFRLVSLSSTPRSCTSSSFSSPSFLFRFPPEEEDDDDDEQQCQQQEEGEEEEELFEQSLQSSLNEECLADEFDSVDEIYPQAQFELKGEESDEKTVLVSDGVPKIEGVVGEILAITRNLEDNSTMGEHLGPYEGRLVEKECLEILGLMCEQGLLMSCLYFYEWMGLQEPSLVNKRACFLLFPALGRARMGDKLMIFWRNLPNTREFRDVHVYNAAMSGLLAAGRCNGFRGDHS